MKGGLKVPMVISTPLHSGAAPAGAASASAATPARSPAARPRFIIKPPHSPADSTAAVLPARMGERPGGCNENVAPPGSGHEVGHPALQMQPPIRVHALALADEPHAGQLRIPAGLLRHHLLAPRQPVDPGHVQEVLARHLDRTGKCHEQAGGRDLRPDTVRLQEAALHGRADRRP